ncbi:MAG: class I SAM-dependent rRNA methyltransferase [Chloroflexota bacterium]
MTDFNLPDLPRPAEAPLAIYVKPAAERALRERHPWLFDGAIQRQSRDGAPGDVAVLFDRKRRFLAAGLYDPASPIRVKVLQHHTPAQIDRDWFAGRLAAAVDRRALLAESGQTNGYRLVNGESDGLPALVIDRYAGTLVMKLYAAIWLAHLRDLLAALVDSYGVPERLILRLSRALQADAPSGITDGMALIGDPPDAPVLFKENGLRFAADVVHGHKTGFFFDQRDNRARVGKLARKLAPGAAVLDLFAYSGGFSLYAARRGAGRVISVDVSAQALEAARANFARNADIPEVAACQHEILVADVFEAMTGFAGEGQRFGLVIVDPPAFAKQAKEIDAALRAYARLATLAVPLVQRGGALVLASCSSRVTADAFFTTVTQAVSASGRRFEELNRTGHALDHPIGFDDASFPEGEYLKALFLRALA